eukprot:m.484219 g.484219  ORF g.484219 m.484219 type:complete len:420 (-) comp23254_c0_seq1:33-1292(-)
MADGPDPPPEGRRERSRTEATETAPNPYGLFIAMEALYDKLQLLDYDTGYCRQRGHTPISRHFFSIQTNASEQLHVFGCLFSWLLSLRGHVFPAPDQYDDPNAVATNIMLELRKHGLPTDFPPARIKQGYGEEIISVLDTLASDALKKQRFKFSKPVHVTEDFVEEELVDADAEITTDMAVDDDEIEEEVFDDDDDAFIDVDGAKGLADNAPRQEKVLESTVDAAEWRLEVERVMPQLKVHIRADNKDWRLHFEDMQQHHTAIQSSLVDTKGQLDRLHTEISRTLEKIGSREKYVNTQLDSLLQEYRVQQDSLAGTTERYNQANQSVTELSRELARLTEELDDVKASMDDRASSMTDAGPLVKIKQALTRIKTETAQMELRTGVVEHILLAAKQRDKTTMVRNMHATPLPTDDFGAGAW